MSYPIVEFFKGYNKVQTCISSSTCCTAVSSLPDLAYVVIVVVAYTSQTVTWWRFAVSDPEDTKSTSTVVRRGLDADRLVRILVPAVSVNVTSGKIISVIESTCRIHRT